MLRKERHQDTEEAAAEDEEIIYRIDIPANRYDMLCLEGIARALNTFKGNTKGVQYKLADMTGAFSFWNCLLNSVNVVSNSCHPCF